MVRRRRPLVIAVVGVLVAAAAVVVMASASAAATAHTVTFVNHSGQVLWIGSRSNGDGSPAIAGLPTLADGQSATITIPDTDGPQHWRGTFFARQGCRDSGAGLRCLVGDCGSAVDHCAVGQQPVSLAEFNFDRSDGGAPWYDVSYVDGMSLPITITPSGRDESTGAGSCAARPCAGGELMAACPSENAVLAPGTGQPMLCLNPNRDGPTGYTANLGAFAPRAYLWSTADRTGSPVVFNCAGCADFVVTFHGGSGQLAARRVTESAPRVHSFRGLAGKCVDVPGGRSDDGSQLQLWDCNGTPAQAFVSGPGGQEMALGKCMDVAWAGVNNGTKVQLAWCNGGPAQVWVRSGRTLRNPHANKCLDVKDVDSRSGAPLQLWDCFGGDNQSWDAIPAG